MKFRKIKLYRKKIKKVTYNQKKYLYDKKMFLKIKSNNMYCTLTNALDNRVLTTATAGKYRITYSKKLIRANSFRVLRMFFREVQQHLTRRGIIINVVAPIKMRKKLIVLCRKLRSYKLKNNKKVFYRTILIMGLDKKCFNGCKASKKRRKKRKSRVKLLK
jgi:hypothetical protein